MKKTQKGWGGKKEKKKGLFLFFVENLSLLRDKAWLFSQRHERTSVPCAEFPPHLWN